MSKLDPKKDILGRVYLIYVVMALFGVAILCRIIVLQTVKRSELLASKSDVRIVTVDCARGNIYSNNGTTLATSVPQYDIYFNPAGIGKKFYNDNVDALADSLSALFKEHKASYYVKLFDNAREKKKWRIVIGKNLHDDVYRRILTFPIFSRSDSGYGLDVEKYYVRVRPYGDMAVRVVGVYKEFKEKDTINVTDTIVVGDSIVVENTMKLIGKVRKTGLESAYDTCLAGTKGKQMQQYLDNGHFIDVPSNGNVKPMNGDDIYTSLDVEIQDIAEEAMRRCLIENKAQMGCLVMMDVETGFVEAMVNLELDQKTGKYGESRNRAISQRFNPGSTFKAITMTAMLENNPNFNIKRKLNLGTTKSMKFHNAYMRDTHVIADGKPTIEQAFWESSNIAFSYLAEEAFADNPQKFIDLIKKTKINEPLKLDLEGERAPYIKDCKGNKGWSKLSLPWMAVGYELEVTPMTLVTYYNAIANNGKMMKPQFVKEIRRGDEVVRTFEPVVINEKIASEKTIKTLQSLLRGVVEKGTAKNLNNCLFPIAGKTGTAQISNRNKGYNKKDYAATFVGYFPADKPKYTCVVVVMNPDAEKKYYGGSVSAPVFKEVAEKIYATRLGVTDETGDYKANCEKYLNASMAYHEDVNNYCEVADVRVVDGEIGSEWVRVKQSKNGGVKFENVELAPNVVPDFAGMNVTDAVYLIEKMGWKAQFKGCGIVDNQSVEAGTKLEKGRKISLELREKS